MWSDIAKYRFDSLRIRLQKYDCISHCVVRLDRIRDKSILSNRELPPQGIFGACSILFSTSLSPFYLGKHFRKWEFNYIHSWCFTEFSYFPNKIFWSVKHIIFNKIKKHLPHFSLKRFSTFCFKSVILAFQASVKI